ncbi:hypothetical protein [Streptomyces cyaneofuscatus]
MGEMAVQRGEAGAEVVSPTAMIDGSVRAVRTALDGGGLRDVGVNPNQRSTRRCTGPSRL